MAIPTTMPSAAFYEHMMREWEIRREPILRRM
jgi:hypothetical protein